MARPIRLLGPLVMVFVIALCWEARAEVEQPLPGLLSPDVIQRAQSEARQQKRDAKIAVRQHARALGYSKAEINLALKPTMVRQGSFKVTANDGTVVEFPWFRTGFAENRLANTDKPIARDAAGKALRHETNKGGIRLHYGVFAEEVYALALKMDSKLALARDAIGSDAFRGAKGGIGAGRVVKVGRRYKAKVGDYVDPASPVFNRATIMRSFAGSYLRSGGAVGPGLDIQAGDVNTKAPEMKVLAEQGYGTRAKPSPGVSGKEVTYKKDGSIDPRGGIAYRATSTGDGVWMSTRLAARRAGLKLWGSTVVAQGWGEVGRAFGMSAVKDGARVVAIQELWLVNGQKVAGTLHNPYGARAKPGQVKSWLAEVDALRASGQDLSRYADGKLLKDFAPGQDASAVRADIVGINALGGVLNSRTVPAYVRSGTHHGRRKILAEGANLAQTFRGARKLDKLNDRLLTISGDLANFGGVHTSDQEAVQNLFGKAVTSARARRSLMGNIRSGWNRSMKLADTHGISERKAIELAAVDGMMKRSLHLKNAPRSPMERRVVSSSLRSAKVKQVLSSHKPYKGRSARPPHLRYRARRR